MVENDTPNLRSKRNFILQQGLVEPSRQSCPVQYAALMFQPRVIGIVLLFGLVLQSPVLFAMLGTVLLWSALVPRLNPFDVLYNVTLSARPDSARLHPAPPPRRFAQTLAGTLSLAIAILLLGNHRIWAYAIEIFLAAAVAALIFGRFCFGSFMYHLLRGRIRFALRTLPWMRDG